MIDVLVVIIEIGIDIYEVESLYSSKNFIWYDLREFL